MEKKHLFLLQELTGSTYCEVICKNYDITAPSKQIVATTMKIKPSSYALTKKFLEYAQIMHSQPLSAI